MACLEQMYVVELALADVEPKSVQPIYVYDVHPAETKLRVLVIVRQIYKRLILRIHALGTNYLASRRFRWKPHNPSLQPLKESNLRRAGQSRVLDH